MKTQARKVFTEAFPDVSNVVDEISQAKQKIQEKGLSLENLEVSAGGQYSILDVVRELSIRIPTRFYVNVEEIEIKGKNITLTGDVKTLLAVEGIVRELSSSILFENIKIEKSEVVSDGYVAFKISLATK